MPLAPKAKLDYPLHWAVFANNVEELEQLLKDKETLDIDKVDPRGRTPLLLAVTIGNVKCAQLLLENGANADAHNKEMWSVSHEAVSLGNPELITNVIHYRDFERAGRGARAMRTALNKLKDVPDFYCEMSWDFSSWVPFLSQACPSDTYKIYKSGSRVRMDTTMASFETASSVRENQSIVFRLNADNNPEFVVLDHNSKSASVQELRDDLDFDDYKPSPDSIALRMSSPITTTYIDVDQIGFERTSRGLLSWLSGSDGTEKVDGYDCRVLAASNVQLVTKKRMEHLSQFDRERIAQEESTASSKAIGGIMKMMQSEKCDERTTVDLFEGGLTPVEYLDATFKFEPGTDIGRPKDIVKKSNSFKATLWMADDYPLSLQEQVIPIVELMAINSSHFARLNNFIRLQLPAGFPAKIEIPLFHVLSARVSFSNVNEPGPYVTPIDVQSNFKARAVVIDDAAFDVPPNYIIVSPEDSHFNITWEDENDPRRSRSMLNSTAYRPSEEMLLQMAIEQSLREAGNTSDANVTDEQLARALQMQFDSTDSDSSASRAVLPPTPVDTELELALRASEMDEERRRREQEQFEEELQKVLELSKNDK
ncbi:unnamed protein product [Caenorhabditis bovis]|uniref:Ankyrin repeat domain-containing protein n=1 Tax=Caenorhabditis bovis TaxID=2654633 RepID=A0A8S1EQ67_9PELO|nr:unnamed protein product [Caenorhabditis bovis]